MISVTEIILIIIGVAIVVLGYVLPAGKNGSGVDQGEIEDIVQDKLDQSLNVTVRRQIDTMAQDAVADAIDDNKLSLSRISNEKVTEISEYAGTVLDDIKKNHDEVVFMYDMLNDKHKNLTSTVTEMTRTAENAKQTVRDAELKARDAIDAVATLDAAASRAREAATALKAQEKMSAQAAAAVKETEPVQLQFEPIIAPDEPQAAPAMKIIRPAASSETAKADPIAVLEKAGIVPGSDAAAPGETVITPAVKSAEALTDNRSSDAEPETRNRNTPNTAKVTPRTPGAVEPLSQNKRILEMHKAGKSNMVIARELGLGIGEVRLVIDLSNKQIRDSRKNEA
ncbi:MAG: hypothetical protein K6C95_09525 [Lachnospiraceae bacterium]|nr:hypothetical protein [Lachnospiraceae bacterium]